MSKVVQHMIVSVVFGVCVFCIEKLVFAKLDGRV